MEPVAGKRFRTTPWNGGCLGNAGCNHFFFYHHVNYFIEFSQEPCGIYKTLIAVSDGEMEVYRVPACTDWNGLSNSSSFRV